MNPPHPPYPPSSPLWICLRLSQVVLNGRQQKVLLQNNSPLNPISGGKWHLIPALHALNAKNTKSRVYDIHSPLSESNSITTSDMLPTSRPRYRRRDHHFSYNKRSLYCTSLSDVVERVSFILVSGLYRCRRYMVDGGCSGGGGGWGVVGLGFLTKTLQKRFFFHPQPEHQ